MKAEAPPVTVPRTLINIGLSKNLVIEDGDPSTFSSTAVFIIKIQQFTANEANLIGSNIII